MHVAGGDAAVASCSLQLLLSRAAAELCAVPLLQASQFLGALVGSIAAVRLIPVELQE